MEAQGQAQCYPLVKGEKIITVEVQGLGAAAYFEIPKKMLRVRNSTISPQYS